VPKWRELLDVNVIGALICAAACRPSMAARGGGVILNQSSIGAYLGGGAYGLSKLALNSLTVGLASSYAPDDLAAELSASEPRESAPAMRMRSAAVPPPSRPA